MTTGDEVASVQTFRGMWHIYQDRLPGGAPPGLSHVSEAAFYAGGLAMLALVHRAFALGTLEDTVGMVERVQHEVEVFTNTAAELVRAEEARRAAQG